MFNSSMFGEPRASRATYHPVLDRGAMTGTFSFLVSSKIEVGVHALEHAKTMACQMDRLRQGRFPILRTAKFLSARYVLGFTRNVKVWSSKASRVVFMRIVYGCESHTSAAVAKPPALATVNGRKPCLGASGIDMIDDSTDIKHCETFACSIKQEFWGIIERDARRKITQ